jgi:hypothetical protein
VCLLQLVRVVCSDIRTEIMQEIAMCSKSYLDNKCSPIEQRLPAMHTVCSAWETYVVPFSCLSVFDCLLSSCMARDPRAVGRCARCLSLAAVVLTTGR